MTAPGEVVTVGGGGVMTVVVGAIGTGAGVFTVQAPSAISDAAAVTTTASLDIQRSSFDQPHG